MNTMDGFDKLKNVILLSLFPLILSSNLFGAYGTDDYQSIAKKAGFRLYRDHGNLENRVNNVPQNDVPLAADYEEIDLPRLFQEADNLREIDRPLTIEANRGGWLNKILGYYRYVSPNSPRSAAHGQGGDLYHSIVLATSVNEIQELIDSRGRTLRSFETAETNALDALNRYVGKIKIRQFANSEKSKIYAKYSAREFLEATYKKVDKSDSIDSQALFAKLTDIRRRSDEQERLLNSPYNFEPIPKVSSEEERHLLEYLFYSFAKTTHNASVMASLVEAAGGGSSSLFGLSESYFVESLKRNGPRLAFSWLGAQVALDKQRILEAMTQEDFSNEQYISWQLPTLNVGTILTALSKEPTSLVSGVPQEIVRKIAEYTCGLDRLEAYQYGKDPTVKMLLHK